MEVVVKGAWLVLAAIHVGPAAVAIRPALLRELYGLTPDGPSAVLLTHRGVLFTAIMVTTLFAIADPGARRLASAVVAISVVGFLVAYYQAGMLSGPLRRIAAVDLIGIPPLLVVLFDAWRR